MKKLFSVALWAVFFALTVVSCKVQEIDKTDSLKTQDITIEEAKTWMNAQNAGARLAGGSKTIRTEYWKSAERTTYTNGWPVVVVPLSYNYQQQTAFVGSAPKNKIDANDYKFQSKLFVYKNDKGQILADVVKILPTDEDRKENKKVKGEKFSGVVLAFDQSETKFMGGWFYEKGKAKKRARIRSYKTARVANGGVSDCAVVLYSPADSDSPAHVGGGEGSSGLNYYDAAGQLWVANGTVQIDGCVSGETSSPETGGNNSNTWNLELGDLNWFMNTYGTGSSGGGSSAGGNGGSYGQPLYQFAMLTDNGVVGYNPVENFFSAMIWEKGISFSVAEKQLIQQNTELIFAITVYVNEINQKPNLEPFTVNISTATDQQVINAISGLMAEPGVPAGLRNIELTLLGIYTPQFRPNLNKYYLNAKHATQRAIVRYGYAGGHENGNGRGNAFKHALFAIFQATSFGRQLAQQLTNVHEEYDTSRSPTEYPIDVQMDLWNNQEGFTIYDANPNRQPDEFDNATHQAVTNGLMRYIFEGSLRPTNQ